MENYSQQCITEFTTLTMEENRKFEQIMRKVEKNCKPRVSKQYFVDILGNLPKTKDLEKWKEFIRENYGYYSDEALYG